MKGLSVIAELVHHLRGQKVMLDADLAALYGVPVKALLQAVKRNASRFPADFMFPVTRREWAGLRSQIVTLEPGRGRHRKYPPYVFTEQGVAMLSSVLRSERAVRVNIAIMRAFVKMRYLALTREEMAARLNALEESVEGHDRHIQEIVGAIESMISSEERSGRRIGFRERRASYARGRKAVAA